MSKSFNRWTRKIHRVGAIGMAIPLVIVILSGLLLQVKKQVAWVQPPTMKGSGSTLLVNWDQILNLAKTDDNAGVETWGDIDRLDVRPNRGVVKVRCINGWELQLDAANGKTLSSTYRRSDLIESIHDGSFFSDFAKLWVFLPNGLVLLLLWVTGVYLWFLPYRSKSARRKRQATNVD